MFMHIQSVLPLLSPPHGVFSQYELGGLGWGAAAGPWLLHAPVRVLGCVGCPGCVMAQGGLYAPRAWCRHAVFWVRCRAEKRPVWSMHQLGAGRKLGNREEGSAVPIQLRGHSHCVNNAIHASESFCFTLN